MSPFQTERTTELNLGGEQSFLVTYTLRGKCGYTPGNYGAAAPEDCYPEESVSDLAETEIIRVIDPDEGPIPVDKALRAQLLTKLKQLPLDDYLFEDFMQKYDGP